MALAIALGLVLLHQALQVAFSLLALYGFFGGDPSDTRAMVKASLIIIFPASLIVAAAAWWLASRRGGDPRAVLSLHWPQFTRQGWLVLIAGFVIVMYAAIMTLVLALGIDLAQYTPGPNGQSPQTGSAGLRQGGDVRHRQRAPAVPPGLSLDRHRRAPGGRADLPGPTLFQRCRRRGSASRARPSSPPPSGPCFILRSHGCRSPSYS